MSILNLPNFINTATGTLLVDTSTTSVSFIDLLTTNIITSAGDTLICRFASQSYNATGNNFFQLLIDGVVYQSGSIRPGTGLTVNCPQGFIKRVSGIIPGNHIVSIQWSVSSSTTGYIRPVSQSTQEFASLVVTEFIPSYTAPITYGLIQTQQLSLSDDTTTSSTSMIDLMTINLSTMGGDLLIYFNSCSSNTKANTSNYFQIVLDSTVYQSGAVNYANTPAVNINLFTKITGLAADKYTVKVQWYTSANVGQIRPIAASGSECAQLLIMEMKY